MQVKRPDTSLSIVKYHQPALQHLQQLYQEHRDRLRAANYPVADAWVKREDWRQRMVDRMRLSFTLAHEIEASLVKCEAIRIVGSNTYVEFVTPPEEREHVGYGRYFCHTHSAFKSVPARQYKAGEEVNFTIDGVRGLPAMDVVGTVLMPGNPLTLEYKGRLVKRARESVTPKGAPPPLLYVTSGRCWCEIDPEGAGYE